MDQKDAKDAAPVADGEQQQQQATSTPRHTTSQSVDTYTPRTISLEEYNKLSRNQKKKLMHQEEWDLRSEEFKEKQRQRNRESRKRKRTRIALGEAAPTKRKPSEQVHSGVRIAIDMDFDEKMTEREVKSMCSQVMRCYSANRQAAKHVDLHVTKLHGKCRERFDTALEQHKGWSEEFVKMHDKEYVDLFPKEELVYLTADSPNVIEKLDPKKVYIVGGIVDKNRYPRLTLDKAEEQGIAHGQLPIGKYVQMSSRKVMTVNQIFEMLMKFIELGDWKTAFLDVIPQRKFHQDESNAGSAATSDHESDKEG
ncbi:hypothetical protein GQ54DRAFT_113051 [Martensiomyces pterosporus]|nr:hypothetical protein GQ54DRAFT_113051 [Martensiomyces pterosporus]